MRFVIFIFLIVSFLELYAISPENEIYVKVLSCVDMGGRYFSSPIETPSGNVVLGNHKRKLTFFDDGGKKIREHKTKGWIHATPDILDDSLVTIGCYDRCLYICTEDGDIVDRIPQRGRIFTNAVDLKDGRILFGMNKRQVVLCDVKTQISKMYRTTKMMHGSPLILSNGNIVIGGNNKRLLYFDNDLNLINKYKAKGWFVHSKPLEMSNGNIAVGSYDQSLHIVSPYGEGVATFETKGKIHASPVETTEGKIVFGSFDGFIYILDQDGSLVNKIKTGKKVVASAATLSDGTLVVPSFDKYLYFISPDGCYLGRKEIGAKIFSTPLALRNGKLVLATLEGEVYFLKIEQNRYTNMVYR